MNSIGSIADIPDQTGRTALITGANSGIGFEAAKALAGRGATVVLGCRSDVRGRKALDDIRAAHPDAQVDVVHVDLASLASVRSAAESFAEQHDRLDLLVNNAGVMAPLRREETADGFEMQFGTNHLGHFALTGLLLDRLRQAPSARVVSIASLAHWSAFMNFSDIQSQRLYVPFFGYAQSKLANLLFVAGLQRRLSAAGSTVIAVAAHPGLSATDLASDALPILGPSAVGLIERLPLVPAQSPAMGALPTLQAAVGADVAGDAYFGPGGPFEMTGPPAPARRSLVARSARMADRLWSTSVELTGVGYDLPD